MPPIPLASISALHLGEFLPPLVACVVYLIGYSIRARTVERERKAVSVGRRVAFACGVAMVTAVQLPPFDGLADSVLMAHMVQHILIGDIASLLIVVGLTGPMLQPLLHIRATRLVRRLSNPITALVLWALDLYIWHLPIFYQLAIRHDLVHALEHACLLWFGTLLWLALLGPLPKPAWFSNWACLGYVVLVRFIGAVLANVLIWAQTVFYPVYNGSDERRGLSALSDQNLAGGIMMVEQIILTVLVLAWLFMRFARQDEERQSLVDFASEHGLELSDARAARAAAAGTGARLRERLLAGVPEDPAGALAGDGAHPGARNGDGALPGARNGDGAHPGARNGDGAPSGAGTPTQSRRSPSHSSADR